MMKSYSTILMFLFLWMSPSSYALPEGLQDELLSYLDSSDSALHVTQIKNLNRERNLDIANAYERYYISKENVAMARAQISPLSTGQLLGVSLGATYLWTPFVVDLVLSLPTKFYNIQKNKALKKAEYWNSLAVKEKLSNEVSKLYFDILTNEFILKTIDLEVSLYNELYDTYDDVTKKAELEALILSLDKESLKFEDLLVKERAALNSMLSYGPEVELSLGQDKRFLHTILADSDRSQHLSDLALNNSYLYKSKVWMYHASVKNLKLVRWSLLSFSGFNLSYPQRVRVAKAEQEVASEEMKLSRLAIRRNVLDILNNLQNTLALLNIRTEKSIESLNFSAGVRTNYEYDKVHLSDYIKTAVTAIRNFRSLVVLHYKSLGNIEDLKMALGMDIPYTTEGILDLNNL